MPYALYDLQACEPDELPRDQGVEVTLDAELDDMNLPRVHLTAPGATALIEYVREHWGDDDKEWFEEYVVQRVTLL